MLTIVFMVVLMFWLDWDFTLIAIAVIPFLLVFLMHFKRAVKEVTRTVRARQSEIVAVVEQGLGSVRAVKAFGRQDLELAHLQDVSHATVDAALKARRVKSLFSPVVSIVVAFCTAIVLWKGTALIIAGTMTAGSLTVYLAYLSKFFKPVQDLASATTAIAQTTVALERIQKILSADEIVRERPTRRIRGASRAQSPSSMSRSATRTKCPCCVTFPSRSSPGRSLASSGQRVPANPPYSACSHASMTRTAGASSSTAPMLHLQTCRSARPDRFRAAGDGAVSRDDPGEHRVWAARCDNEEIVAAARIANADEFIARMPHGYDSMVGERGDTLSGGQRQRIGIARAVVRDSPIMILDEPTAALDTESEHLVIEGLRRLMAGRTVIMIAHRLSTIRNADKIIVLKDGIVAEEGSNDELIARGGIYAELNRAQFETARPNETAPS